MFLGILPMITYGTALAGMVTGGIIENIVLVIRDVIMVNVEK